MTNVPDDLADLLLLWWLAERRDAAAMLGLPRACPSTRGYCAPRSWDAENGVDDARSRAVIRAAVGRAVDALPDEQRIAIHIMARNLSTGAQDWSSARLPDDAAELGKIVVAAVRSLCLRLGLDTPAFVGV